MAGQVYLLPNVGTSPSWAAVRAIGLNVSYNSVSGNNYWAASISGATVAFFVENSTIGYYIYSDNNGERYYAGDTPINYVGNTSISAGIERGTMPSTNRLAVDTYPSASAAYDAITGAGGVPISYIISGCTVSGPDAAASGDTVSVSVTLNNGMVIKNPTQGNSISVYDNNGYIPFTFSGNTLTFVVP